MSIPLPKLTGQIRRVINRSIFIEKRSVAELEHLRLFPSEIHLLQIIREGGDLSAGEMARRLGISNGAVSQTLKRLERKGVIRKNKIPALKNKLTVAVTSTGTDALRDFEKKQDKTMKAFSGYLTGLTEKEKMIIQEFLGRMEEFLQELG